MKKILFLLAFLFVSVGFSINSVNAESVMEPQWAEFCPPLYENAVFKPAKENSKRNMENNYWALRKAKFNKSIAECKAISKTPEALGQCFGRVAHLERSKTQQRSEARAEAQENIDMQIRDGGHWWWY